MNWKTALAGLILVSGAAWLVTVHEPAADSSRPGNGDHAPQSGSTPMSDESALGRLLDHVPRMLAGTVTQPGGASPDRNADVIHRDFDRLRVMPPGNDAIALAQQLEAAITPGNTDVYLQALLATDHPAIERVVITALARTGDAAVMLTLAGHYGSTTDTARGRILQVLEAAENPAATSGLSAIVTAETSEKRSPVMMSAMYGIANTGSVDSVQYLLRQLNTDNAEYSVMALERVRSSQGLEMIRQAAEGSKDGQDLAPSLGPALRRIVESSSRS